VYGVTSLGLTEVKVPALLVRVRRDFSSWRVTRINRDAVARVDSGGAAGRNLRQPSGARTVVRPPGMDTLDQAEWPLDRSQIKHVTVQTSAPRDGHPGIV